MKRITKKGNLFLIFICLIALLVHTGCGGGGGGGGTATTTTIPPAAASCGDGAVNTGEVCDAGAANTNTVCTAAYGSTCQYCNTSCQQITVTGSRCGDAAVNGTEQCDSGSSNTNTACVAPYGGTCNYCDLACLSHIVTGSYCGDGVVGGTEQCDDSNTASGDGCSATCVTEVVIPPTASCGDGSVNAGEACDNGAGNTNTACTAAYGSTCQYCNTSCQQITVTGQRCGDSITNGAEICDNGASNTNTACSASYGGTCNYCDLACLSHMVTGSYCGDGIINAGNGEQCDDSNTASGDGCSSTCQTETFTPPHYDSECNAVGNPRGMAVNGSRLYYADSTNSQVVVINKDTCAPITTLSAADFFPDSVVVSADGSKILVGGGGYGEIGYWTFNGTSYTDDGRFGSHGTAVGQFDIVEQCAYDSVTNKFVCADDTASVANTTNHRVQAWDVTLHTFSQFGLGGKGVGTDQYNRPWGVVIDSRRNYYVADTSNNRIKVLDSNGSVVFQWNTNLASPTSLAVDGNNRLYVANTASGVIAIFYYANSSVTHMGDVNVGGSFVGIAVLPDGTLYVGIQTTNTIKKYVP